MRAIEGRYVTDTADKPTQEGIDNSSARLLPKGTVAFCRTASVGKVAILGRAMATSQDFANWVCGPEILPEYLFEALRASTAQFDKEKQGTTHKTIYMPVLEAFQVLLPPKDEQCRIADILDRADTIRRKRAEAIALTDQLLRSTFLEMFGDPVTNPKRWPVESLDALCESKQYGTAVKANEQRRGLPVVRMNNITYAGELDLRDLKWVEQPLAEAQKLDLRDGDVLFNRVNSPELVGKTAAWRDDEGYTFAGYLIRLRMRPGVSGHFVSAAMNMGSIKKRLKAMAKPSVNMANISGSDLSRLFLPVPPEKLQRRFEEVQRSMRDARKRHAEAERFSSDLASALAHQAFAGEP